ncbi:hypothetical protein ACIP88_03310 [Streptomyces uncialis]|uniref:hypothetical protein n=1 Tax=Streptomyces uncialis TaxID=1048205 RepID=UPI003825B1C3
MSSRSILRRATLLTAAIGGVLAPAGAAVASDSAPDRSIVVSDSDSGPSSPKVEVVERDKATAGEKTTVTPRGGVAAGKATPSPVPSPAVERQAPSKDGPAVATPRGGVAAGGGDAPVRPEARPAVKEGAPVVTPRGGVAAGERVAAEGGGATAVAGSAAGLVMLAGAGTIMLRRRAAHRNG